MNLGALFRRSSRVPRVRRTYSYGSLRPSRFVAPPAELAPARAALAEDIYDGVFRLPSGRVAAGDGSPFLDTGADDAAQRELHAFVWLKHLAAAGTAVAAANARALLDEWRTGGKALPPITHAPDVSAARLTALLANGPFLLAGAPAGFRDQLFELIAAHIVRLDRIADRLGPSPARLKVAIALAAAAAALDLPEAFQNRTAHRLAAVLGDDLLPDGTPRSRAPDDLLEALAALLPVVAATEERGRALPEPILTAIDRMAPMVAFFLRTDGTFAAFNGTGATPSRLLTAVLAALPDAGAAPPSARYGGYQRLQAADVVILVDTGTPPPAGFTDRAHAGPLSFELSDGSGPVVVNCGGMPPGTGAGLATAARTTPAHTTLVVEGTSTGVPGPPRMGRDGHLRSPMSGGPDRVDVTRNARAAGPAIQTAHDGWRRRFGVVHERTLTLDTARIVLSGRDSLVGPGTANDLAFAIRFHLHPSVKTSVSPGGRAVVLTAENGTIWRFGVEDDADLHVEESVFATPNGRVIPARQIRLSARTATTAVVRWRFERQLIGYRGG